VPDDASIALANDQALAFIGLAFTSYSPQLALLAALVIERPHAIPLPFGGIRVLGIPLAGFATGLLLLIDDFLVAAFAIAAVVRYEAIFTSGAWPTRWMVLRLSAGDWSQRAASLFARAEISFTELRGRFAIVLLGLVLFLGVSSSYILWWIWQST